MTDKDQNSDEVTVDDLRLPRRLPQRVGCPGEHRRRERRLGRRGPAVGSALLVVKRGPNAGSRFLLDQPTTSAGRHPDSDIFLDDVTVSRRHAEFRLDGNEFQVVDVGSLNGTYVNRAGGLRHPHQRRRGQIGKFRLVFLTGPPLAATRAAREAVTAPIPRACRMSNQAVLDLRDRTSRT